MIALMKKGSVWRVTLIEHGSQKISFVELVPEKLILRFFFQKLTYRGNGFIFFHPAFHWWVIIELRMDKC
jgi:hypothetical protein